nr:MAG TPA: DNA-directed RNA polymerase subunit alpha [Caudoviricetes sp.]
MNMENFFMENYYIYQDIIEKGKFELDVRDITIENYYDHFNAITNILRDGIELEEIQNSKIYVKINGEIIPFTITEYWINLMFWTIPIYAEFGVSREFIFDTNTITKSYIKQYFDKIIKKIGNSVDFISLNNLIDEAIYKMKYVNEFAMYLSNTLNFKDTIDLMREYPEFNESMHSDLSAVPIEDVIKVGMDYTETQIKYITAKDSKHCLKDSFIAKEGVNKKQYKEVASSIGTKPDGRGSVYPYVIQNSFMNGGVDNPESLFIDSSVGRIAQILQKMNVGISGSFARLLETNNIDTFFNMDSNYSCGTRNFIKILIKDSTWLKLYDKRYYKFNENGPDYLLNFDTDKHLIGKTLYFRSPITCESYSNGTGICHKCYGELYNVNRDINPGKIAAELLSAIYTQMLLSAKHLLESSAVEIKWCDAMNEFFDLDLTVLSFKQDLDIKKYSIIIDPTLVESDDDDESEDSASADIDLTEFVSKFEVLCPNGHTVEIYTQDGDNIYFTEDLSQILNSKKIKETDDGKVLIPGNLLENIPVFYVKIQNKELQRTLERSKQIINKSSVTESFTKDGIVSEFISANLDGNIMLQAIHLETIIANQVRTDEKDSTEMPDWRIPNVGYKIISLNSALSNSPSITVTLEYQKIASTLVNPISAKKHKASVFDLFFMEKPQDFIVNQDLISEKKVVEKDKKLMRDAIIFFNEDGTEIKK